MTDSENAARALIISTVVCFLTLVSLIGMAIVKHKDWDEENRAAAAQVQQRERRACLRALPEDPPRPVWRLGDGFHCADDRGALHPVQSPDDVPLSSS